MLTPQLRLTDLDQKIIVDLFAGGGGMSVAMEMAWGRSPDIAINHSEDALSMHRLNHPQTEHYVADVFEVDPRKATRGRPVGWLHMSPDCFPAGTMILTREGYRPIEEVSEGDEVLTHRLRWRKVTQTFRAVRPLIRLRGQGHPGLLVSPEHPFYARQRKDVWRTNPRGYQRTLQSVEWVRAGDLDQGSYWATPAEFPEDTPPAVPVYRNRETIMDERLLWLAGRYLADGWTRITDNRAEVVITCGHQKVEALRAKLSMWPRSGSRCGSDEIAWNERDTATAHQFTCSHRGLVEWLREHFGHGAAEKKTPGWSLGMVEPLRQALLDGYISGDGCEIQGVGTPLITCTTVSKSLAFGLKSLATSLGHCVSVYLRENQPSVIQGRKVNVRPIWSVRWRKCAAREQSFTEGGMSWTAVKESDSFCDAAQVFNFAVEDDESYIADGIIVHNCTHFSQAKGGQPRSAKVRALAWVGIRWAGQAHPDWISLENVKQFVKWGPLIAKRCPKTGRVVKLDGTVAAPGERTPVQEQFLIPDPKREGQTYRRWCAILRKMGYDLDSRNIVAANQGGHTTRERHFEVGNCIGESIRWAEPTHFKKPHRGQHKWKPAADCIDWSIPCPSIFERKRPLADATLRRIARGIHRYVLESADPFIVSVTHQGSDRVNDIRDPFKTITAAHRGEMMVAAPTLVQCANASSNGIADAGQPLSTVTAWPKGGSHALSAATLVQCGYGEREGQAPRSLDLQAPLGTVVGSRKHALACAYLMQANDGFNTTPGHDLREPTSTVTNTGSQQQLVTAILAGVGGRAGQIEPRSAADPVQTVTAKADTAVVTAHLAHLRRNCDARNAQEPLRTISAGGEHHGIVTAHLVTNTSGHPGVDARQPAPTVTTGGHHGIVECTLSPEQTEGAERVAAFMMRYYGEGGQWSDLRDPMTTITTKDRMALVTVIIKGTPYVIIDIGLRMLEPRELFRAQDFPDSYIIDRGHDGRKFSKSTQVRMVGNSVNPMMAVGFLTLNAPQLAVQRKVA